MHPALYTSPGQTPHSWTNFRQPNAHPCRPSTARFSTSSTSSTTDTSLFSASPCITTPNAPYGWRSSSLIGAPRDKPTTHAQSKQPVAALDRVCLHDLQPYRGRTPSRAHAYHELIRHAPPPQQEGLELPQEQGPGPRQGEGSRPGTSQELQVAQDSLLGLQQRRH
jgi:hypothetical protein